MGSTDEQLAMTQTHNNLPAIGACWTEKLPHSQTHQPNNDMTQITVQWTRASSLFVPRAGPHRDIFLFKTILFTDRFTYSKQSKEMRPWKVKEKNWNKISQVREAGYSHVSCSSSLLWNTVGRNKNERCSDSLMEQYQNVVTETRDVTVIGCK